MTNFKSQAVALSALGGVGVLLAFSLAGGGSTVATDEAIVRSWQQDLLRRAAHEPKTDLAQNFQALASKPEPMPAEVRRKFRFSLGPNYRVLGLRLDEAQYLLTPGEIGGLWASSGRGITCITYAHSGASSCNTTAEVAKRGLSIVISEVERKPSAAPERFLGLGVVPDGISRVALELAGGSSRTAVVTDNAWTFSATTPILKVHQDRVRGGSDAGRPPAGDGRR